jgi:hypothetical protein
MYYGRNLETFCRGELPPPSGSKGKPGKQQVHKFTLLLLVRSELLALVISVRLTLLASTAYFSMLKIEPVCFSETSVNLYQTKLRHIPGDSSLYSLCQENVKSRVTAFISLLNPVELHKPDLTLTAATLNTLCNDI